MTGELHRGTNPPNSGPGQSSQRPTKRPRVAVACLRCKARRQKCDNQLPACSNCARAALNCTFPEDEYPSSYVKALESRVAWLEMQLDPSQRSQSREHLSRDACTPTATGSSEKTSGLNATRSGSTGRSFANSVGLLSLQAAAEPQYFGVSSGVSLALMIEAAVYDKVRPSVDLNLPAETPQESPFSSVRPRAQPTITPSPSKEEGAFFIEAYLSYIHPNFPFLSKRRLWDTRRHGTDLDDAATDEVRHGCTILQLVYAIGSRCLQLVGSANAIGVEPERYYSSAMADIQHRLNVPSVHNIQIMLLVAIYALRSPSGSSVWHLCGLMIRQCLELGLHRQQKTNSEKQRLFWCIYHLERRVALVLGRPLAITDDEIDLGLPHDFADDNVEDGPHISHQTASFNRSPGSPLGTVQTNISFHGHMILLDQLNTKSRLQFCRLAKSGPGVKVEKKITKRFQELEAWRNAIFISSTREDPGTESIELIWSTARTPFQTTPSQQAMPENQRLALLLNYHRARRMLLQTMLTDVQRPNHSFPFSSFAKSSGEVCQLNRRLHRLNSVPFTLLDLHSVFVAGFSMIYCAWTDPELYDAEMASDLGACSTVLYLIAEQWGDGAKKYRDAFEMVAGKTAEYALKTRQSREGGRQQHQEQEQLLPQQQTQANSVSRNSDNAFGVSTQYPCNAYGLDETGNEGWANDNFDVWQMMTQFVHTQESDPEYDTVNFTEIEGILAEEGLGWFNGGSSMRP